MPLPHIDDIHEAIIENIKNGIIILPSMAMDLKKHIQQNLFVTGFYVDDITEAVNEDVRLIADYATGLIHGMEDPLEEEYPHSRPDDMFEQGTREDSSWHKAHVEIGTIQGNQSRIQTIRTLQKLAREFVKRRYPDIDIDSPTP